MRGERGTGVFDVIYTRRSIRNFDPTRKIPEDIKAKILDSARYAPPSPLGEHPWRMIVVSDPTAKKLVADCAQEVSRTIFGGSFEAFFEHLWYMPPESRLRVAEYTTTGELWRYPEDCDMLIIPTVCKTDWGTGLAGILRYITLTSIYQGFAAQNMWLTASALGVGAGYNAMPLNDARRREIVATYLGIPHSWEPTGGFAFGYSPAIRASGPSRAPLEAIAYSEYWGNNYERIAFRGGYEEIRIEQRDFFDVIKNLNMVESFEPGRVEDWMIERILDSAIWGPNPENFRHWRYIIIRDRASKEFLYKLVSEKRHAPFYFTDMESQLSRLWFIEGEEERFRRLEEIIDRGVGEWYLEADVLILPLAGMGWVDSAHTRYIVGGAPPIFHIATGCCMQNIFIAATALGLGFNYDPHLVHEIRYEELLRDYFGIPHSWAPLGVIGIGIPGRKALLPPPPPLEKLFYEEYWGNPYSGKKAEI